MAISTLVGQTSETPGGVYGGIAVLLTALSGLIVAGTALVKAIRRTDTPPAPPATKAEEAVDDDAHADRAWQETLEQLDAANERAERAEAESRYWRDKYVKLLEEARK